MTPTDATPRLAFLRAALDAMRGLGDDAPDLDALLATLKALDPALSGDALGAPAFHARTGMPTPDWIEHAATLRASLLVDPEGDDLPDEGVVSATALDPELGHRLLAERTFHRFLRRNPLFPRAPRVVTSEDGGPWWVWDTVLEDGRWARLRAATGVAPASVRARWFTEPLEDVEAALGVRVRRVVVGPVWPSAREIRGLWAVREVRGEPPAHRLVVDRDHAEDVDEDAYVVPFAVPSAA